MNDYLEHHGIQGQKWGVQNGPPYPLDSDDYSTKEKRLNKLNKKFKTAVKKSEKALDKRDKLRKKSNIYDSKAAKRIKKVYKHEEKTPEGLARAIADPKHIKYTIKRDSLRAKADKYELKAIKFATKASDIALNSVEVERSLNDPQVLSFMNRYQIRK